MQTLEQVSTHVDELLHRYTGAVPGASVLVAHEGKPFLRRVCGQSNLELAIEVTPETNFRLASLTKQFTAAAILVLVQDERLSIDDPVLRWLPSLPSPSRQATIRQLLTHTSGIIDYEELIPDGPSAQLSDADVLALLESQHTTYFAPGSAYRYSNSGYALLALVVERAAAERFAKFLHDRIFIPLGMSSTVAHEEGVTRIANRAFGYSCRNGEWVRNDQSPASAVLGDGGIYSSIDDLAKWDAALYDSSLLADQSRRLAFTAHTSTDLHHVHYGFGWRVTGELLWHSGETVGFRNVIMRNPGRRLTVVILTNRDEQLPYEKMMTQMVG